MTETRTLTIERDLAHPADKVWRALTQGHLIETWLMKTDFEPVVGKRFQFRSQPQPQWDGIIEGEVLEVEPPTRLAYRWESMGLKTIVAFTLTPTPAGVRLRMEQSGFPVEAEANYQGATYGWGKFLAQLDEVVAKL
jgi:uncharacterized protein YndB with AHSA1/START domain